MTKAVFFSRDGTLTNFVERSNGEMTSPYCMEEFSFIPGAQTAVEICRDLDYATFVVTNQPGVYEGNILGNELAKMMRMCLEIGIHDALVAFERGSAWYKPHNGMIETLVRRYKIDRSQSFMVGDRWKDIVAGHKSKLTTIFVGNEYFTPEKYKHIQPDFIVHSTLHAACFIEELSQDE